MADNKRNKGGRDRSRVAGGQEWEMAYLREKMGVSTQAINGAIRAVGNDRKKVEAYLRNRS
jgi:hypothetical protein